MQNKLMEEDESFYKDILNAFGEDLQFTMMFEEMGELSQAIAKYLRKKNTATAEEKEKLISHISEEIADVKLCLEELQYIFNSWDEVKKWKNLKVERGKERVNKPIGPLKQKQLKI